MARACDAHVLIAGPRWSAALQLQTLLRSAGYTQVALQVTDPAAPLEGATAERAPAPSYDLVLLQLELPDLQGFAAIASLMGGRHGEQAPPVLAITSGPGAPWRALQAGARDCVSTPFDPAELLARMHHLLDARQAHQRLVAQLHTLEQQLQRRGQPWPVSEPHASALPS